jgi:iron complex transport system permease protein
VLRSSADERGRRRKRVWRAAAVRHRRWRGAGLAVLLAVLAVTLLAGVSLGSRAIGIGAVYDAFLHYRGSTDDTVVRGLRVPRTLLGLAVGVALGLAGAVMQGVTRNPLADPGILGVNAGAAFAVVIGIHFLGVVNLFAHVWFAIGGAAAASVIVYALGSRGRQGASPVRLALAGAATTAFLGALTNAIWPTAPRSPFSASGSWAP